ncbi:sugar kinase [Zavarzinella formosa]|uniref:sugar kinase n=1 Tax=Zavarzinella formosa TaxID=360055 RepID=UPI000313B4A0|nr:sugar kinase [Zavarzinella formosa]
MDVVTFGEAMIRLTPANFRRLEQAYSLDVEIGGAELNTAVGLARLGRTSAWASRLTDNPLGHLIANRAREAGVSTEHVLFTDQDRVGVYFLELGASPRPSGLVYDRADSAMAKITPGMIDWAAAFKGVKWFYLTGITAALSPSSAEASLEALQAAKKAGLTTCLDPNYRAKLWTVEQAAAWLNKAITYVDVLVTNPEDVERFFGVPGKDVEQATAEAAKKFNLGAVAMTMRQTPSVWKNTFTAVGHAKGQFLRTAIHEVEIVDRLGAGDAFVSGLIHGLMNGDLQQGLDYGAAMGALKHTVPGDFPWLTKAEVEGVVNGMGLRIRR